MKLKFSNKQIWAHLGIGQAGFVYLACKIYVPNYVPSNLVTHLNPRYK